MRNLFYDYFETEEVVTLLQQLIRIPSHRFTKNREAAVGDFIFDYCSSLGFDCQKIRVDGNRCNILVTLRGTGKGPTLLLNGHIDTVPPYDMLIEPFKGFVKDGAVWGRGANDMKGALASMIVAMTAIDRSGIKLKGDVLLSAVVGEECESDGTEAFILSGGTADGAVVGEPSDYGYSIGHRGLETMEIKVSGTTMHSGQALKGINAIQKAAKLISRIDGELLPRILTRTNEYMGPALMNYGKIEGGDQVCTVAGECTIQFDRRYVAGESIESVIAEYQQIIDDLQKEDPDFHAQLSRMPNSRMKQLSHAPLMTAPDAPIVKCVEEALETYLGKRPLMCTTRGWTDAGILSYYGRIPTVVCGPGALAFSHTKDEHIPIDHLVNFVSIYADIAAKFCGIEDKTRRIK